MAISATAALDIFIMLCFSCAYNRAVKRLFFNHVNTCDLLFFSPVNALIKASL